MMNHPRDTASLRSRGMSQVGGKDEKGLQQGQRQNDHHYHGERAPEFPGLTRDKKQWDEGHDIGQNAEGHGAGNLAGSHDGRGHPVAVFPTCLVDIFANHNGIIDNDAKHHEEPKQGNHVDAHSEHRQEQDSADEGDDHAGHDPKRQSELKEQR